MTSIRSPTGLLSGNTRHNWKIYAILVLCLLGGLAILAVGFYGAEISGSYPCICRPGDNPSGCSNPLGGNVFCSNGCPSPSGQLVACPLPPLSDIVGVMCGIIVMMSGILAYTSAAKRPSRVRIFGVVALVFSLISLADTGGLIIGLILGLIGGILALLYKG